MIRVIFSIFNETYTNTVSLLQNQHPENHLQAMCFLLNGRGNMEKICIVKIASWAFYSGVLDRGAAEDSARIRSDLACVSVYLHLGYTEGLHNTEQKLIRNQTSPGAGSAQLLGPEWLLNNNHTKLGFIPHLTKKRDGPCSLYHLEILNCGTYFIYIFQSATFLLCFRMTW